MLVVPCAWFVRRRTRNRFKRQQTRGELAFALFSFAWPFILGSATFHRPAGCVHTQRYFVGPLGLIHTTNHGVSLDSISLGGDWYIVLEE